MTATLQHIEHAIEAKAEKLADAAAQDFESLVSDIGRLLDVHHAVNEAAVRSAVAKNAEAAATGGTPPTS